MSDKSLARHVQAAIDADAAYEPASYMVCLNLVRKYGPALREALHQHEQFHDEYRAALVKKAKETFHRK